MNLGRISRWTTEKKDARVNQFLEETEQYLQKLEEVPKKTEFIKTFKSFQKDFRALKNSGTRDNAWAEAMLTWGNILTHRARLA